jgi:hypothetical protein
MDDSSISEERVSDAPAIVCDDTMDVEHNTVSQASDPMTDSPDGSKPAADEADHDDETWNVTKHKRLVCAPETTSSSDSECSEGAFETDAESEVSIKTPPRRVQPARNRRPPDRSLPFLEGVVVEDDFSDNGEEDEDDEEDEEEDESEEDSVHQSDLDFIDDEDEDSDDSEDSDDDEDEEDDDDCVIVKEEKAEKTEDCNEDEDEEKEDEDDDDEHDDEHDDDDEEEDEDEDENEEDKEGQANADDSECEQRSTDAARTKRKEADPDTPVRNVKHKRAH